MKNELIDLFEKLTIFRRINQKEIMAFLANFNIVKKSVLKNETILMQGDNYENLYILIEGECYGEITDVTGRTVKIEAFSPPVELATAVLFADKNIMPGSVIAKTNCYFAIIKKQDLLLYCTQNKQFLQNFLSLVSNKFLFLSHKLSFLSFKTIKVKLARYILSLPCNPDGSRKFEQTLEELADYFSVLRPSLSRVLGQLEQQNIIRRKGKILKILDQNKLLANSL